MTQDPTRASQLLRGVLDVCLLAVIAERPAYGYEMRKRLADRGLAPVGEGSIYPVLGRLERERLVESFEQASNGGPPRKYYRPTRAGRQALVDWSREWQDTRSAVDAVLGMTATEVQPCATSSSRAAGPGEGWAFPARRPTRWPPS